MRWRFWVRAPAYAAGTFVIGLLLQRFLPPPQTLDHQIGFSVVLGLMFSGYDGLGRWSQARAKEKAPPSDGASVR